MYFSGSLVQGLVIELARVHELDTDSVHNLIYHLKLPGDAVPRFIASIIREQPSIGCSPSYFPGRLAYGIVDEGMDFFDESTRYSLQTKLCKQVHRIRWALEKWEHPVQVIDQFENHFSVMIFATSATKDLGAEERELSNAELGTLVERVIEAVLVQNSLSARLLERVVQHFDRKDKERLRHRVSEAVHMGLENDPWEEEENTLIVCDLNEPVRFRKSLCEHERFRETSSHVVDLFDDLCC